MGAPQLIVPGTASGTAPVGGTGTTNTIPRWTGPSTLGDSGLIDDGSTITSSRPFAVERAGGTVANTEYLKLRNTTSGANSNVAMSFYVSNNSVRTAAITHLATSLTNYDTVFSNWNGSALAEVMRLQQGGNVGIGTASPTAKLHVTQGSSPNFANLLIGSAGTSTNFYDANEHYFRNGSLATGMYISSLGNVGIGTASPGNLLTLSRGNGSGFNLQYDAAGNARTGLFLATRGSSSAIIGGGSEWADATTTARSTAATAILQNAGVIQFFTDTGLTSGNTFTPTERARIDSAGRLLVGTSTAPNSANVRSVLASSVSVYAGIQNTGSNVGCAFGVGSANFELYTSTLAYGSESYVARMAVSSAGTAAQSQVAIGTSAFTTGRALTTVADLDVFGVRVGRGPGDIATNTAIGAGALSLCTTGSENTVLGQNAGFGILTGARNVMIGAATGSGGTVTGSRNIVVGRQAGNQLTSGSDNILLGNQAGDSITTGSSNIVIGCGAGADVAAATDSNKLVIGDATNYVATNGGATTYYATAGALAGYIIVRLNGTDVKLPVYAL